MKRASLLVAILALAAVAGAIAAPAAAPSPAAFHAVSQPAPQPAAIIGKGPCDDFCSRAYCVQGTTCGPNPTTGKCGCWPDQSIPSSDI